MGGCAISKTIAFFLFTFIVLSFISLLMDRQYALAATASSASITQVSTGPLLVEDASAFQGSGHFYINEEIICYASRTTTAFATLTRGCKGTDANAHPVGARPYSDTAGLVDNFIRIDLGSSVLDKVLAPITITATYVKGVARIVMWDFSFLGGNMSYLKYFLLYPLSAGFVWALMMVAVGAVRGVFGR